MINNRIAAAAVIYILAFLFGCTPPVSSPSDTNKDNGLTIIFPGENGAPDTLACGTPFLARHFGINYDSLRATLDDRLLEFKNLNGSGTLQHRAVFHILSPLDNNQEFFSRNIDRMVDVTNEHFKGAGFQIANYEINYTTNGVDPYPNYSVERLADDFAGTQDIRKYEIPDAINIFIARNEFNPSFGSVLLGFAYAFGWDEVQDLDFFLFNRLVISTETLTRPDIFSHEVGHYLGLDHVPPDPAVSDSSNLMGAFAHNRINYLTAAQLDTSFCTNRFRCHTVVKGCE